MRHPPIEPVDAVQRWREEADAFDQKCKAEKSRLQRADRERQAAYTRAAENSVDTEQRLASLEARMDRVEESLAALAEVANGAASFSDNTVARFGDTEAAFKSLTAALDTMRETHRSELAALRDRVSGKETTAARERAARAEQLNDARFERGQRDASREHMETRKRVSDLNDDVQNITRLVVKDIQRRGG
jgi:hypothetical protein